MRPEAGPRFTYWRDPVFLLCLASYIVNRALIKPNLHEYSPWFHGHFDDTLTVPVALPLFLAFYRLIGMRPDDAPPRWWEVLTHTAVWIVFFEWFGPLKLHQGVYDPIDAWCIGAGGLLAWMFWQRDRIARLMHPGTQPRHGG